MSFKKFMKIFFIFFLFLPAVSLAHPVIYKNGWVYWGQFSHSDNIQRIIYTFHPHFAVEFQSAFHKQLFNYRDFKLGLNTLVKRWLFSDSQANFYASLRGGFYRLDTKLKPLNHTSPILKKVYSLYIKKESPHFIAHPQIELDWESRKLYTALSLAYYYAPEDISLYQISYRFGFAPYVGDMEELQTWLIFKLDYFNFISVTPKWPQITPMMRFFYKNALWEIGSNLQGNFFTTLMIHY